MQWLQSANAMATKPFHPRSATDIRLRAERRAGDLLREMADRGERDTGYGDRKSKSHAAIPKLKDLVVTKTQSSRWHRVGLLDADGREVRAAAGAEPCNGKLTLQIKDGWLSRCSRSYIVLAVLSVAVVRLGIACVYPKHANWDE